MNAENGNQWTCSRAQVEWGGGEMIEIKGLNKEVWNLKRLMI